MRKVAIAKTEVVTGDKEFENLVGRIKSTSDALLQDALVVINRSVTARAWLTGYYIVEYEQHGKARAEYGEQLLKRLAKRLEGENLTHLKNSRLFYQTYPELQGQIVNYLFNRFGKSPSVVDFFNLNQLSLEKKSLPLVDQSQNGAIKNGSAELSLSVEQGLLLYSGDDVAISPVALFNRLSFTHIVELIHLSEPLMRTFYAFEAIRGAWGVRALRRQIASQYYQRVGWAKDPHKLAALAQGRAEKLDAKDFIKQNTVLEFLGLEPRGDWDESDLEQGICDRLRDFLLEIGDGFCFEARQQKVLIDDVYEKIDLVFYHRVLKCHVIIELKPKKLNYKDVAQLNLYMAYYRKHKMTTGDNPPIGILLCTAAGKETVEYLAPFTDPQLFISTYELQLPKKEQLTAFLKKENEGLAK